MKGAQCYELFGGIALKNHAFYIMVFVNYAKSEWLPVTSGVTQDSVLGSVLFIIYINDIDANVSSSILRFADDTKLHSNVCPCDQTLLLDKMFEWSTKWQMPFNDDKCNRLHVGQLL